MKEQEIPLSSIHKKILFKSLSMDFLTKGELLNVITILAQDYYTEQHKGFLNTVRKNYIHSRGQNG